MPSESYAFRVAGIEPRDPSWHVAGDDAKQAFYQAAVKWVEQAMDRQLAAGKDRFGADLVPIAESTRKKGRWRSHTGEGTASNPPLTPAQALSRTRSLFDARAHWREGYILGFWRFDQVTGRHWGQILGFHRKGNVRRNLPQRDVIGLSPYSIAWVRAQGEQWWLWYRAGRAHGRLAGELTLVIPPPSGRPIPVRPMIVAPESIDLSRFTFGIGGSEASLRQAIAEGRTAGYRRRGETVRRSYLGEPPVRPPVVPPPPKPPPSGRPKPVPWVHPARIVPGRGARKITPAAASAPVKVPVAPQVTPVPVPRVGEPIPPKPGPQPIDVGQFAKQVKATLASVGPEGRYFDKVFIHHAHEAYVKAQGPMTLEAFKAHLVKALQQGHVSLSRADLVEAMNALDVQASLTLHPAGAEFNFIRTD